MSLFRLRNRLRFTADPGAASDSRQPRSAILSMSMAFPRG